MSKPPHHLHLRSIASPYAVTILPASRTTLVSPSTRAQLLPDNITNICTAVSRSIPDAASNTTSSDAIPNDASTSKLTKPHAATYTSQNGPWKTSLENTLTKTRNWMAHIFPWQTVKAFFEKTLTKTSNLLARILSQQIVEQTVDFYETKARGMGTACRKAGCNIFKRATSPSNTTNSTSSYLAMQSSASRRSIKSWVANKVKIGVFSAVTAVRVLCATATMGLDAALAAVECAGAVALYALDTLCEDE